MDKKQNTALLGAGLLRYLMPVLISLVAVQLILMPFIFKKIYAHRPQSEDKIITYDRGKLNFGTQFDFAENGDIMLDLFDAEYDGATSANGDKIVVPGTDGHDTVQLRNNVHGDINYTAVLYVIRDTDALPVKAELQGIDLEDTDKYSLPFDVSSADVIRAVSGTVSPEEIVDFEILWRWDFYESDEQDKIDTALGSENPSDGVIVGLNLTVDDDNIYIAPEKKAQKVVSYCFATFATALSTVALFIVFQKSKKGF